MLRRVFLLLVPVVAFVVVGTRCAIGPCGGVHQGTPCLESQVGSACPGPDGTECTTLVCDGVEFGPHISALGDTCTQAGLICGASGGGSCASGLQCNGTEFIEHDAVGPGAACSQAGTVCHWPGTECDTCTCDGKTFQCKEQCCLTSCLDGG